MYDNQYTKFILLVAEYLRPHPYSVSPMQRQNRVILDIFQTIKEKILSIAMLLYFITACPRITNLCPSTFQVTFRVFFCDKICDNSLSKPWCISHDKRSQ